MRFANAAFIGALLTATIASSAAVAIPAAEQAQAASLAKRQDNGAWCGKWLDSSKNAVQYIITTWGVWDDDWGNGLLDNVRGQCDAKYGNTENWAFNYQQGPPPTDGSASFRQAKGAGASRCVEDAIWLASDPTGAIWNLECKWL